ncbi:uncharacterized protein BDR25DRAFT_354368 [Lindgomyces ingoldianus]|uniref:Uncharacterized protein n=1 Tax=Lindgomyces ingoldianus TaxID=673940 RepID=A0ACB6QZ97_9PLEO|nr:uncharacterized protein BDR25DRAFT_354368 [Lindgomyces ingoldianus]KAF2471865.1 hypothetical protein BDR25DRAFT_354368 [Lindgomyces ingoldianus]
MAKTRRMSWKRTIPSDENEIERERAANLRRLGLSVQSEHRISGLLSPLIPVTMMQTFDESADYYRECEKSQFRTALIHGEGPAVPTIISGCRRLLCRAPNGRPGFFVDPESGLALAYWFPLWMHSIIVDIPQTPGYYSCVPTGEEGDPDVRTGFENLACPIARGP